MAFSRDESESSVRRPRIPPRLLIAVVLAIVALGGYFMRSSVNPITGRTQHISLTVEQELALGLQSAPEMARQFGGVSTNNEMTDMVKRVGADIVSALPPDIPPYRFQYHLLADQQTVNAFALPGGQIFITEALLSRLQTEGQLAGVLGHETGHVLGRHSAEQMAKSQLAQGLVGAAGVAGSDGTGAGSQNAQAIAGMVGNFVLLKYGRDDELEADRLGLRFMTAAGYNPRAMIGVMKILEEASGGNSRGSDFAATHPNPGRRAEVIEATLKEMFPSGMPEGLRP